jgi:hypothetical protein
MVGKSPLIRMTGFSNRHGPKFNGTSILLQKDDQNYIFVGERILEFEVDAPDYIVRFVSPLGNSDVPYPFAVDNQGRFYLFIENVVLESVPESHRNDPYDYWYDLSKTEKKRQKSPLRNPVILVPRMW